MENRLRAVFEYQKFEKNSRSQSVIDSVHAKYWMNEIRDEDLRFVNAAGSPGGTNGQDGDEAGKK